MGPRFSASVPSPGPARAGGLLPLRCLALLVPLFAAAPLALPAQVGAPVRPELTAEPPVRLAFWRRHRVFAFEPTSYTNAVAVGDLSGNGHLDMVVGGTFIVHIYSNRGDVSFTSHSFWTDPLGDVTGIALGDLTGNGHTDMVLAQASGVAGAQTAIYLNDGRGAFTRVPVGQRLPDIPHAASAVALADVDGNGSLDLFIGTMDGQPSRLYLNDGRGFFQDVTATHFLPDMEHVAEAVFADVTGNGFPDLVLAMGGRASPQPVVDRVYLNDGTGRFRSATFLFPHADWTYCVAVGDVDGDGRPDLLFGNEQQDRLYLNAGGGNFVEATDRLPQGRDWTLSVAIGDLDGDGHPDIVKGINASFFQGLLIYRNDGRGFFEDRTSALLGDPRLEAAPAVRLADVDGDGDLDLFAIRRGFPASAIWYMNLTRHLSTQETVTVGGSLNLTFHGDPEQFFFPALSLEPARIPIPGLGTLGLDPARLVTLPPAMIPRAGRTANTRLQLPADPALRNRTLYSQALVVDPPRPSNTRFTNWVQDLIR